MVGYLDEFVCLDLLISMCGNDPRETDTVQSVLNGRISKKDYSCVNWAGRIIYLSTS